MTTYLEIQDDVLMHDGRRVLACWSAHVKELNRLAPVPPVNTTMS